MALALEPRGGRHAVVFGIVFGDDHAMTREPLAWPDHLRDEEELEELLARPSAADVELLGGVPGDVLVLGAGGKMGPSLARRLKRAADAAATPRRVTAVSRFSSPASPPRSRTTASPPSPATSSTPKPSRACPTRRTCSSSPA